MKGTTFNCVFLNQSTLYTYDSQGKLLTQTDANKQTTRFAYNDLGQRVSRTLPEGQVESSSYNTQGDLLSTKNFKGETTTFKYNGKEQLESITYPDKRTITHSYNAKGDLTETKDSQSGSLTYQRDDLGQTLKVTTPTGELGYTWNGNGQKLSQSINQLGSYQYSYDALGRIVAVEAIDGSLTQFGYDDVGNRTHIKRANGSESFYSYNDINQLTKVEHKQGNQTLASFEYKLDNMGRKVEAKEIIDGATRTLNYEYDIEGRLLAEKITEAGKTSEIRYTHDAQGNRLTKLENGEKTVYGYNKNDQLLTETISKTDGTSTTINYGWDANGNLISKKSDDQTIDIQYGWNSANRLIKVTEGSRVTTYQYDGEDRRIGKVITDGTNTTETQYLIDSERNYDEIIVAKTRTTNGTTVGSWKEELYLYAPDGVGDLLLQSEEGTEHLYQDGKGSTRLVVNNNGTKTTFDYDAFGNPLAGNNPQNHIKHRYVGEVLDEETGFYYFRARHYDPKIGRFISRDSFEGVKTTPISLNPYLYAHADPVNGIDPTGYFLGGIGSMMNSTFTIARTYITAITPAATAMGRVLVAVARTSVRAVANEIRRCARGKACVIPNLLVIGKDNLSAQEHIADAQTGNGSNGIWISPVLKFESKPHTTWYNKMPECSITAKAKVILEKGYPSVDCDEYPFNASTRAGAKYYGIKQVSLRPIHFSHNRSAGWRWGEVGREAAKNKRMPYIVVAPMGPFSFHVNNNVFNRKKK